MNLFKEVADIKTADQLHLPTPEVAYHTIATKPTQIQQDMSVAFDSVWKTYTLTLKGQMTHRVELGSDTLRKRVKQQEKEIRRLKEENEFLAEASAFFAASRRKSAKGSE